MNSWIEMLFYIAIMLSVVLGVWLATKFLDGIGWLAEWWKYRS